MLFIISFPYIDILKVFLYIYVKTLPQIYLQFWARPGHQKDARYYLIVTQFLDFVLKQLF